MEASISSTKARIAATGCGTWFLRQLSIRSASYWTHFLIFEGILVSGDDIKGSGGDLGGTGGDLSGISADSWKGGSWVLGLDCHLCIGECLL